MLDRKITTLCSLKLSSIILVQSIFMWDTNYLLNDLIIHNICTLPLMGIILQICLRVSITWITQYMIWVWSFNIGTTFVCIVLWLRWLRRLRFWRVTNLGKILGWMYKWPDDTGGSFCHLFSFLLLGIGRLIWCSFCVALSIVFSRLSFFISMSVLT